MAVRTFTLMQRRGAAWEVVTSGHRGHVREVSRELHEAGVKAFDMRVTRTLDKPDAIQRAVRRANAEERGAMSVRALSLEPYRPVHKPLPDLL